MILNVSHLKKSFLDETVLEDATFHIEENEKAAIVGHNGAGKSTIFKIITGEYEKDGGEFSLKKGARLGYLSQISDLNSDFSIFDEVLRTKEDVFEIEQKMHELEEQLNHSEGPETDDLLREHAELLNTYEKRNGYAVQSEIQGVLKGLGFSEADYDLKVSSLSGGEKTRVSLSKLLLEKPDLLLLDEPTNHLDLHALEWLENYIDKYKGAVLLISHDRYFLDHTVTKIIDLEQRKTRVYEGNYSEFSLKKKALFEDALKEYKKQQDEINHQEEVIRKLRSYGREKQIKRARSREKVLDRMERIEKPMEENRSMRLHLTPSVLPGNDILEIQGLRKSFGERTLFFDADLSLKRGEHVLFIGDNGTGKTTFFRILMGLQKEDGGSIRFGTNVEIGYYDQEHQDLNPEKTIFDEISDEYPKMTNEEIRTFLAAFLFVGDQVFQKIDTLSGGEKGRVALAKLMLSKSNVLLLDEPTNHLDMDNKEILEDVLLSYDGTVLSISHDRYFIDTVATRIVELYKGHFINYIGGYDYYLEKKDLFHQKFDEEHEGRKKEISENALNWQKQKEEAALLKKREKELQKIEADIATLEEKISSLDSELQNPEIASNSARLMELTTEKDQVSDELSALYDKWEELSEG